MPRNFYRSIAVAGYQTKSEVDLFMLSQLRPNKLESKNPFLLRENRCLISKGHNGKDLKILAFV